MQYPLASCACRNKHKTPARLSARGEQASDSRPRTPRRWWVSARLVWVSVRMVWVWFGGEFPSPRIRLSVPPRRAVPCVHVRVLYARSLLPMAPRLAQPVTYSLTSACFSKFSALGVLPCHVRQFHGLVVLFSIGGFGQGICGSIQFGSDARMNRCHDVCTCRKRPTS